jgi:hypothetical protein
MQSKYSPNVSGRRIKQQKSHIGLRKMMHYLKHKTGLTPSCKNTNHQQMHKESFIINCNILLHVSTLLGHLQVELFVIATLRLHFIVE